MGSIHSEKKIPLVVVAGPTASGKTALAIELAKRFQGEIISADSMQIYQEMDIATAKPSKEEQQGIVHHLMDFLPVCDSFSVADYVTKAKTCIQQLDQRGTLPIVAGGTGLYIQSLVDNIQFSEEPVDEELREQLKRIADQQGGQALLQILREFDRQSAEKLHPNNIGRIIRAIEVYRTTGITMSEQQIRAAQVPSPYQPIMLLLNFEDRDKLYDRINQRVDRMMQMGLLEEAKSMYERRNELSQTALQAIGYKELFPYFAGLTDLDSAIEHMKQETRRYAKRQLSWFRRDNRYYQLLVDKESDFSYIIDKAQNIIELNR